MTSGTAQWLFIAALAAMLVVFNWMRRFFPVFAILVLPGTCAHELCHLLAGLVLNGEPAGFNLLPRRGRDGRGWELGSVGFANLTWYNAFFIGMAPLLLLPGAYALVRWRLAAQPVFDWREALAVYLIANLVYAALPSWQDCKLAARSPIGWLLLAGGLAWGWRRWQARVNVPPAAVLAPRASCA